MAWAEKIPSSGKYRGRYRDASGKAHTLDEGPFTQPAEARRAAAVAEDNARRRPGRTLPRAGRITWGAWVDIWWPQRGIEPGTLDRDASRRVTHLEPRWATTRLDAIRRDDVQAWVDELHASGMAPATVANCYHLLSASLKAAVLADRLPSSPCVSIRLPTKPPPDERYLTWDEVESIAHFLDGRDALLVWFLVGTGVRWGEGVGTHLHRLHIDDGRLDVHEVWDQRAREVKPYPKGRQKRSVPLPSWLAAKLEEHLDGASRSGTCGSTHRRGSRCRSPLLFPGRDGKVIDYDSWHRSQWERVVGHWEWRGPKGEAFRSAAAGRKKLGKDAALARVWQPGLVDIGPVTIHDLRHTYASWLIQDGVSIEQLSGLLGHAQISTTQRYSHLGKTQWSKVRAALDARAAPLLPHDDHDSITDDPQLRSIRRSTG